LSNKPLNIISSAILIIKDPNNPVIIMSFMISASFGDDPSVILCSVNELNIEEIKKNKINENIHIEKLSANLFIFLILKLIFIEKYFFDAYNSDILIIKIIMLSNIFLY